jgi:hypothetical protein
MAVCASGSGHVEVMVRGEGHAGRYGGTVVQKVYLTVNKYQYSNKKEKERYQWPK